MITRPPDEEGTGMRQELLALTAQQLNSAVQDGALQEICHD
ncbi:hypothetical protein [Pigmentiphaga aceris]|nr:hypothetical protein [Pigmentiphaga aceris]